MKKAIIDLDDVIALDGYLNMLNSFKQTNYKYEDIENYYVESILSKEELIDYKKFFKEKNVYDYVTIAPYAYETLMKMMLEYEIYICSSYYSGLDKIIMPELITKKCEFLMRYLPFLTAKNFIFANDKTMIMSDIKIDDRLDNLSGCKDKILYTAYHNLNISEKTLNEKNIIRVNNWLDIEKILIKKKVFTK